MKEEGKEYSLEEVKKKAEEGDPDFQYHWGLVLQHGRDGVIERDPRSALQLMGEAARQGHHPQHRRLPPRLHQRQD